MSFETISPNMNLTIPGVALTSSPAWAEDINNSLTLIDSHDHSPGQGVQITPAGININAEFPINDNDITEARSVRFTSQGSPLSLPSDLGCIYVSGADLYYNDTAGNQVRITQSGAVVGTPGSITALTSPASATYVAGNGTFVWQQAVNTAANMDMASAIIRKDTPSSPGITIAAPVGLSADYTAVLPPAPPAVNSYLAMDTSGNISTNSSANIQVSPSSGGTFSTSSTSAVDIPNLSVTGTFLANRPVMVTIGPDGAGSTSLAGVAGPGTNGQAILFLLRDGSVVNSTVVQFNVPGVPGFQISVPFTFTLIDLPSAGSHTYKVQIQADSGANFAFVQNLQLTAWQI